MDDNDMTPARVWPASNSGPASGVAAFPPEVVDLAMGAALDAARACAETGDVPVGATVFGPGGVVTVAGNSREGHADPTAHAEIAALRAAASLAGEWRLEECGIAVTLEPCPMCAGALVNARLRLLVYGASDPKAGAAGSLYNICQDPRLNHRLDVIPGFRGEEAGRLLSEFFDQRR